VGTHLRPHTADVAHARDLEGSEKIQARHVSEAIQYLCLLKNPNQ